ncbi:MAG: hypothetical protein ACUVR1_03410 [Fimbriimonadales bacterium]
MLICLAIIALLVYGAYRRVLAINARIAQLDEERARNPLDSFSALMEIYRLQEERKRGTRDE